MSKPKVSLAAQRLFCVCLVWLVACIVMADPAGINILSRNLEISGHWTESWHTAGDALPQSTSGSFNEATIVAPNLALSISSAPFGWGQASAALDSFSLSLHSDSAPAFLDYDWGMGALSPTEINLYATARTRFFAEGVNLILSVTGAANFNYWLDEQELRLTLKDVTSSTDLLDLTASSDWYVWQGPEFAAVYAFPINHSHEYELGLSGWITSWDSKYAELRMQVEMTAVPEPRTLVLMALSLAFLWFRRSRR